MSKDMSSLPGFQGRAQLRPGPGWRRGDELRQPDLPRGGAGAEGRSRPACRGRRAGGQRRWGARGLHDEAGKPGNGGVGDATAGEEPGGGGGDGDE